MKKPITGALLVGAAVAALALPAAAPAHPGVYEVTAKLAKAPEVQTITVDATGGSFKPSAGATAVDFDATAAEVQEALEKDAAIGYGNVAVTQDPDDPFPYELTFQGALAQTNVAQVVPDGTGLTGGTGVSAATVADGNGANITYPSSLDLLANQRQAIIANDGYVVGIRETNNVPDGGVIQYKNMPSAYRAPMTQDQKRAFGEDDLDPGNAQTGYQAHATCQGVAPLESGANILAWQSDPFYNYIPWQNASAGLGDNPATWIPVVQTAVGIDLSALNTVGEFTTACQSLGGTYTAADTVSSVTGGYQGQITALTTQVNSLNTQVTNLNTQVGDLNGQVSQLTSEKDALTAENGQLSAERDSLQQQLEGAGGDSAAKDRQIQSLKKQVAKLRKKLRRS